MPGGAHARTDADESVSRRGRDVLKSGTDNKLKMMYKINNSVLAPKALVVGGLNPLNKKEEGQVNYVKFKEVQH